MLAERIELDVPHAHQILVPLLVERVADDVGNGHLIAAREPVERRLDPSGRPSQAFPRRVFAELLEHLADERLERRARRAGHGRSRGGGGMHLSGLHLLTSPGSPPRFDPSPTEGFGFGAARPTTASRPPPPP